MQLYATGAVPFFIKVFKDIHIFGNFYVVRQSAFIFSKLTIETLEQGMKYVQKLTIKTPKRRH